MFTEYMLDKRAFGNDNETATRLEDIKTIFSKVIVKQIIPI